MAEFFHPCAVFCTDREAAVHPRALVGSKVTLVAHGEDARGIEKDFLVVFRGGVHDVQHDVGVFRRGECPAHSFALYGVAALAYPRRIHEVDAHPVALEAPLDGIAGGARGVGDDGAVGAEKGVHERALARIGSACEHGGDAVLRHPARIGGGKQRVHARERVLNLTVERREHFVFRFLRIVEHRLQPGDDVADEVAYRVDLAAQRPVHESICRAKGCGAFGSYHVRHALGVCEGKSARKIGALRELPSLRKPRARAQSGVQRTLHYPDPAVQIELHGVLACIRSCGGEEDGVAFVFEIARVERAEAHIERRLGKGTGASRTNENGIGDRKRVLTGHAQDADTTCPYGR